MVHVGGISPSLGSGLPKSPSFHQGLAFAAVIQPHDSNKQYQTISALHYQPLQPLLIGIFIYILFYFINNFRILLLIIVWIN